MRILIAEDEFLSRRLLLSVLSQYGECDSANDGASALQALWSAGREGRPYALVCLDVLMPAGSGLEVLRALRADERERGVAEDERTRVVMTTAVEELPKIAVAFQAGCDAYLTKPVDRRRLEEKLREFGLVPDAGMPPGPDLSGEARKRLSDEVSALLRQATGKGPAGVKAYVDGRVITLVVDGALSALEVSLLGHEDGADQVDAIRSRLLAVLGDNLRGLFRRDLGVAVTDLYSHVDHRRDKQIIVARVEENVPGSRKPT